MVLAVAVGYEFNVNEQLCILNKLSLKGSTHNKVIY